MEQQKNPILKGNMTFNEGRDDVAIRFNTTVCQPIFLFIPNWSVTEASITALCISYQNIPDVYFRKHNYPQAIDACQDLNQPLKSYYSIKVAKSNIISAFDCTSRRAGTELATTVKRLDVFNGHDKNSLIIFPVEIPTYASSFKDTI
jgi:hypothetical protein